MEQLKPYFAPLEGLLEWGGTKKDITFLVVSALALIASFARWRIAGVDPAWIAIVFCGAPIVIEAIIALATEFDIKADVLVSCALIASICIGEYFAAGEVAVIMQLGALLEELTVARAQAGIKTLVDLAPRTARLVLENGELREIAASSVPLHATVRVLPGETVPVDGVIVDGETSIDESVVTGEPLPVDKGAGSQVSAGTVNRFGSIDVRATKVGEDSSIARMARLVQSADAGKAKIVRLADRWATWVVVAAVAAAVGVYLITGEVLRAVTVLVVFCPCSLVLATPTAIVAAIGNATKHGFLVKEGDALERLADTRRFAFDKTGTLTIGKPKVKAIEPLPGSGLSRNQLYKLLATAELRSEHPLGKAIVAGAEIEGIQPAQPATFAMQPGLGVSAKVQGHMVHAGNLRMMLGLGLAAEAFDVPSARKAAELGGTVTLVAVDGKAAGIALLADEVRTESAAVVGRLKESNVEPVMLTGDSPQAAKTVAAQVGISEYRAACRPEDKLSYIEECERTGSRTAMVGDGINDAPALKRAFVGIAMGGVGSDIAVEAADIVAMDNTVQELPHLVALSRHMMKVIKLNLTFSMTLNFVAIVLAFIAVLDPVSGALVHNCGSVLVIVNSGLLLAWKPQARQGGTAKGKKRAIAEQARPSTA